MFATSGDILNMSLAIGFIILVIFVCMLLFYGILILRDVTKVVDDVEAVVSRVKKTIVGPLQAVDYLIEKLQPYIEAVIEKKTAEKKKKS
ncbi:hypothetical protein JKY72_00450 [Candidatus Gracilibacteria bacterium]|nr:hypothetical protein [Candidatus Gracilibacteria bacterium]